MDKLFHVKRRRTAAFWFTWNKKNPGITAGIFYTRCSTWNITIFATHPNWS